jgi:hypothetical protein
MIMIFLAGCRRCWGWLVCWQRPLSSCAQAAASSQQQPGKPSPLPGRVPQVYVNGINVALGKSAYQTSHHPYVYYPPASGVDGNRQSLIHTALGNQCEWLPYLHAAGAGGGGVCRRSGCSAVAAVAAVAVAVAMATVAVAVNSDGGGWSVAVQSAGATCRPHPLPLPLQTRTGKWTWG